MTESGEDGAITRSFDIVAPAAATDLTLLLAMGLALLGSVLLNLMPCVLPVLSIKEARHASTKRLRLRRYLTQDRRKCPVRPPPCPQSISHLERPPGGPGVLRTRC